MGILGVVVDFGENRSYENGLKYVMMKIGLVILVSLGLN